MDRGFVAQGQNCINFTLVLRMMKSNNEIIAEINTLAKKQHGDMSLAWSWGCAQALLSVEQLDLILGILKDKEVSE